MESLIKAFIWHNRRGTMRTTWPSYGFDEWFLLAVMYPRWAFEGVLTFFHWRFPELSFCHALDVEYATWANPGSEVFRCPQSRAEGLMPWEKDMMPAGLAVREQTTVFRRERKRIGPAHRILTEASALQLEGMMDFGGNFAELLDRAASEVSSEFWVDLNPRLRLGEHGGRV